MVTHLINTANHKLKANPKTVIWVLKAAILLYPLVFIFQDGDVTDTGFHTFNYQIFFEKLSNGTSDSLLFLTNIVGATWLKYFPSLGLLGLKLLYLLVFYGITIISYKVLRLVSAHKLLILCSLLVGVAFATRLNLYVFYSDVLSWFFLLLVGYFILKGQNKPVYIFISGICFVLAILSRFPNLVFYFLFPFVILYRDIYIKRQRISSLFFKNITIRFVLFTVGIAVAGFIFVYLLRTYNYYDAFLNGYGFVNTASETESNSSYTLTSLISSYLKDILFFLPHLLSISAIGLAIGLFHNSVKVSQKKWFYISVAITIAIGAITYSGLTSGGFIKYMAPAICFVPFLYIHKERSDIGFTALLFLVLGMTHIAGTNTGFFYKMNYSFIILLAVAFIALRKRKNYTIALFKITTKPILSVAIVSVLLFSFTNQFVYIFNVASGISTRFKATHVIKHPKLKAQFTNAARAEHIKIMSEAIETHSEPHKQIFIYGHQPLFYYLTESKVPLEKFWLANNIVEAEYVFNTLNIFIEEHKQYPLIIDTKEQILGVDGELRLESFLKIHNYKSVEATNSFTIWKKQ